MPLSQRKSSKNINKPIQSKLPNFASRVSSEASCDNNEANTSAREVMEREDCEPFEKGKTTEAGQDVILAAIENLKSDFSSKLDGILSAIENVKKEVDECAERVGEAEIRISTAEDSVANLQVRVQALENKNKDLEEKVLDLETRSRRSNLRLVNLPEGAEGEDACTFLEKWIPEALNLASLRTTLTIERAHRIGQKKTPNTTTPRTLIMKFLNYKDKSTVIRAARAKGQVLFKNHPVRFYEDLAAGVHKKQKEFDGVRQKLRALGIRYGMIPIARLLVTHDGQSHIFTQPAEAETFVKTLKPEGGSG